MASITDPESVFCDNGISSLAKVIAGEFANRDLSPLLDFPRLLATQPRSELPMQCLALRSRIVSILRRNGTLNTLRAMDNKPVWLGVAFFRSGEGDQCDINSLASHIAAHLLEENQISMDQHIENLKNYSLCKELGIDVDEKTGLTDLTDPRLQLMRQAIIFDNRFTLYPHQFLRRYYTSSFVSTPSLLKKAQGSGAAVSLRIDPLRKTDATNYRKEGQLEADAWYGPPFSQGLLDNPRASQRTVHYSTGIFNMSYEVKYTVFRTKMMEERKALREISIEEYCSLVFPNGEPAVACGGKNYIQKFGHLVYDQKKRTFEHVDGAVRVLPVDQYRSCLNSIEKGQDVNERIGDRQKLFLVRGNLSLDTVQKLITEWFRYNPHIQEYFSNTKLNPMLSYEDFARVKAQSRA